MTLSIGKFWKVFFGFLCFVFLPSSHHRSKNHGHLNFLLHSLTHILKSLARHAEKACKNKRKTRLCFLTSKLHDVIDLNVTLASSCDSSTFP